MTAAAQRTAAELGLVALLCVLLVPVWGPVGVGVCLLAAWGILRLNGEDWPAMGFGPLPHRLALPVSLTLALIWALAFLLVTLLELFGLPMPDLTAVDGLQGDVAYYLLLLAASWTMAAFGEELLVRGFVLHRLCALLGWHGTGFKIANFAQALLFGLGHAYQGLSGVLITGMMGLVLGWTVQRTGSLWIAILTHGILNSVTLTLMFLGG